MNQKHEENVINIESLAGIQYLGMAGITQNCLQAIVRLIHYGDRINIAKLLTSKEHRHTFILDVNDEEPVAIKSGFASGYGGTGPKGLSVALQILCKHNIDIEEYEVDSDFMSRLDQSCLSRDDLEKLNN